MGGATLTTDADVVIIGAGFAGLAAADRLVQAGKRVIILEARDRLGGRACSLREDGRVVELGAQWISPAHRRVKQLVQRFGFTLEPSPSKGKAIYDLLGKRHQGGHRPPLHPLALLELKRLSHELGRLAAKLKPDRPWSGETAKKLDAMSFEPWIKQRIQFRSSMAFVKVFAEELLCCTLREVSVLDVVWNISTYGVFGNLLKAERYWLKEGTQALAERFADSLGCVIQTGCAVAEIRQASDKVYIETSVGCLMADRAVVCIPPALIGSLSFDPPLPGRIAQLLYRMPPSAIVKVILYYESPFWRKRGLDGTIYTDSGPFRVVMDTSPQEGEEGRLTVLIPASLARRYSTQPLKERRQAVLNKLTELLGMEAAHPLHYYDKDWTADPYTRGGYGSHLASGVITELGSSLGERFGRIHWSGSETATEHRLYMEGALQSGERVAREILDLDQAMR